MKTHCFQGKEEEHQIQNFQIPTNFKKKLKIVVKSTFNHIQGNKQKCWNHRMRGKNELQ